MPTTIPAITIPQGTTLTYGATPTSISHPTSISGLDQSLAAVSIQSVSATIELRVPGRKTFGDITVTANYIETEFTGIQTVLDSRAQTYLTLTTSGSIATTPNITTAVFNGYFTKITTPSIADNSDPLTYEFTFMVVSITIT